MHIIVTALLQLSRRICQGGIFRGVSTKYLDNYLAWNGFEAENPGVDRLDLKTLSSDKMQALGKCSTYQEIFHKPPLPFPVAG